MTQPAWFATWIVCVPASTDSTCASWKASTAGLYSEYFTFEAPRVSPQTTDSPSTGSDRPGFQNRVSSSTGTPTRTLKLSVLLKRGTKHCLLPFALQSSCEVGVTQTL